MTKAKHQMTNKERLEALFASGSYKDMVRYFATREDCSLCAFNRGSRECDRLGCKNGIVKWLKSEVEE